MSSQFNFIVHDEPASRPVPAHIAMVDLEPFGFPGQMEQMWLRPLEGNRYEVCCLPFRVYGLAMGDIVALDAEDSTVTHVIRASGSRVFRIFFPPSIAVSEFVEARESVVASIENAGLKAEWSGDRHVAIDIPVDDSIAQVWDVVRLLEGVVTWEWSDVEPFRAQ